MLETTYTYRYHFHADKALYMPMMGVKISPETMDRAKIITPTRRTSSFFSLSERPNLTTASKITTEIKGAINCAAVKTSSAIPYSASDI